MVKGFSDEFEKDIDEDYRRLRRHHADINLLNEVIPDPELDLGQAQVNGHTDLFGQPIKKPLAPAPVKKHRYRDRYISGFIKNLASDSSRLDGYNCSLGIIDEYHSAKNSHVRDVIRSSQAMRTNPLLITITTAGFDKSSPCFELRQICTDVISGSKQDESLFSVIFSLDEGDNWQDPGTWIKANPNLGVTVKKDFINQQVQQAINSPSDEVGIKTKNLNIWCDSISTWIPDDYVIKSCQQLKLSDFKGWDCFVGVDLASNTDLTAVSYLFFKDEIYYFYTDYYLPADTLKVSIKRIHADKNLYKLWYNGGFLKITPGNVTDYEYIAADLIKVNNISPILMVYYDPYNANAWAIQCTEEGLPLEPFKQVIANFNNPTREFERLMLSGRIIMDDNPITRYCLRNVELRTDMNGNVKPMKDSLKKKVDGVIAMLQALAGKLTAEREYKGIQIY